MSVRTITYRIQAWSLALIVIFAFGVRAGHHLFESLGCEHAHEEGVGENGSGHEHARVHRCDFRVDGDSPHFHAGCDQDHRCDICAYHFSLPELFSPLAPQSLSPAPLWRLRATFNPVADVSLAYSGESKRRRGPPEGSFRPL